MIDFRNRYRLLSPKRDGGYWEVQMRRWFSPFWTYINFGLSRENGALLAWEHANPVKRVAVHLGALKGEPKP